MIKNFTDLRDLPIIDALPTVPIVSQARKERPLIEIIEKVAKWRRLYQGVIEREEDGTLWFRRYSLQEASHKVGISKRSLDDYLLHLRYGIKNGFDFESNKYGFVGQLRKFARNTKDKSSDGQDSD